MVTTAQNTMFFLISNSSSTCISLVADIALPAARHQFDGSGPQRVAGPPARCPCWAHFRSIFRQEVHGSELICFVCCSLFVLFVLLFVSFRPCQGRTTLQVSATKPGPPTHQSPPQCYPSGDVSWRGLITTIITTTTTTGPQTNSLNHCLQLDFSLKNTPFQTKSAGPRGVCRLAERGVFFGRRISRDFVFAISRLKGLICSSIVCKVWKIPVPSKRT